MAVALAGCSASDEEQPTVQPSKATPITVEAMMDGATRAVSTTTTTFTQFQMWGFQGTGSLINGGAAFTKDATTSKWSGSSTFFWEDGKNYQFFGISPYASVTDASITATAQSFGYAVPTDNAAQKDILVSSLLAQQKTADGTLSLPFKHALSMVTFKANTATDLVFEIHSLTLCNIKSGGTFTFSTTTDGAGTWADNTDTTPTNYAVTLASDVTVTKGTSATVLTDKDGSQVIILRPQVLTAWNAASTVTSQAGSYIAMECKIHTTGGVYYGSSNSTTYATVYLPLGLTMAMHKRYNLTLNLDGIRKADGTAVLSGVVVEPSLTATVRAWDNSEGNNSTITF